MISRNTGFADQKLRQIGEEKQLVRGDTASECQELGLSPLPVTSS